MEVKNMATIKFLGELTLLNGITIRQGETRQVSENQANSLIAANPDQWALVGGNQLPVVSEVGEAKPKKRRKSKKQ